jgi:hypothetical protein
VLTDSRLLRVVLRHELQHHRHGVRANHYGQCLLRVADMAVQQRMFACVAMASVSDRGRQLRRRLERLFETVRIADGATARGSGRSTAGSSG